MPAVAMKMPITASSLVMFMEVSSGRRLRELLYGHEPCGSVPVRAALRAVDRLHPVEISIWH
ncbi:Uncharacterised protein [Bordetella pertussis]|nr:Uncharacterised protein [Bordetella pertussis]